MSTLTVDAPTGVTPERPVTVQPVTQARVIRSEWIKFSTLRSTWITLVLSMIGTIGIGALASW
jgi:ABC-2 type transport system permease protein